MTGMERAAHSTLQRVEGASLAYVHVDGALPTVVFLGGYASDMSGAKALFLEDWARERGQAFLRLDYSGHGQSGGEFAEGSIGAWLADALDVIDFATDGPLLLVGSSMGGWIGLLAALRRRGRVRGFLGIAAAPDFTEDLMWNRFDESQRQALESEGQLHLPSDYTDAPHPVMFHFIEEGRDHLLLRGVIPFDGPVRLVQGLADPDVPWDTSVKIAEQLESDDVRIILAKSGDHRLSEPDDLALIAATLEELLERVRACPVC